MNVYVCSMEGEREGEREHIKEKHTHTHTHKDTHAPPSAASISPALPHPWPDLHLLLVTALSQPVKSVTALRQRHLPSFSPFDLHLLLARGGPRSSCVETKAELCFNKCLPYLPVL